MAQDTFFLGLIITLQIYCHWFNLLCKQFKRESRFYMAESRQVWSPFTLSGLCINMSMTRGDPNGLKTACSHSWCNVVCYHHHVRKLDKSELKSAEKINGGVFCRHMEQVQGKWVKGGKNNWHVSVTSTAGVCVRSLFTVDLTSDWV